MMTVNELAYDICNTALGLGWDNEHEMLKEHIIEALKTYREDIYKDTSDITAEDVLGITEFTY